MTKSKLIETELKLSIALEIIEKLEKSNDFYASGDAHESSDSCIQLLKEGRIRFSIGKLARKTQKDVEILKDKLK